MDIVTKSMDDFMLWGHFFVCYEGLTEFLWG